MHFVTVGIYSGINSIFIGFYFAVLFVYMANKHNDFEAFFAVAVYHGIWNFIWSVDLFTQVLILLISIVVLFDSWPYVVRHNERFLRSFMGMKKTT
jgi:hypothetical protein